MTNWDWKDAVGKRVLIKSYYFVLDDTYVPREVRFLELAPSGRWIKIQYLDREEQGSKSVEWVETDKVEIIEVLED